MKQYLADSDEMMGKYYDFAKNIMSLTTQGNVEEISRLMENTAPPLINEFEKIVESMESHQQKQWIQALRQPMFKQLRF